MKILQKNIRFMLIMGISVIFSSGQIHAEDLVQANFLPLHALILNQNISTEDKLEQMQNLIARDSFDINTQDANGKTALNLATFYKAKPIVIQFFIVNKANVNLPDLFNETPLHNAIRNEEILAAQMLLQAGADKNFKNDKLETPIDLARSPKTLALFGFEE